VISRLGSQRSNAPLPSPVVESKLQGPTEHEMRQHLRDWLRLVVHEPSARIAQATVVRTATENDQKSSNSKPSEPSLYFNANLARFALLGYYGCWSAKKNAENAINQGVDPISPTASLVLPRLLLAHP
jgi:hypothetical protein